MSTSDPQSFEDASKKVASAVSARFRGPLFAAFAVAWALFNWRILVLLAAPTIPAKEKITDIQSLLGNPAGYWLPILFALTYTLVAPWITVLLRLYADIPDSRLLTRERRKKEDALTFDQHLLELQVRHLNEQRKKLDAERELSQLKNQLSDFFDTAHRDFEKRADAAITQADGEFSRKLRTTESEFRSTLAENIKRFDDEREELKSIFKSDTMALVQKTEEALNGFARRMTDIDDRAKSTISKADEELRDQLQRMHRETQKMLEETRLTHQATLELAEHERPGSIMLDFGARNTDKNIHLTNPSS